MKYLTIILLLISTAYGQNINYYFQGNHGNDSYEEIDSIFNIGISQDIASIKLADETVVVVYGDVSGADVNGRIVRNQGSDVSYWGNESLIIHSPDGTNLTYITKADDSSFFTLSRTNDYDRMVKSRILNYSIYNGNIYSELSAPPYIQEISGFSDTQFLSSRVYVTPGLVGLAIATELDGNITLGSFQEQKDEMKGTMVESLTDTTAAFVAGDSVFLAAISGSSINFSSAAYIGVDALLFPTNTQVKKLTDTSFVMVYMSALDDYVARIGTITGTTLALGSEYRVADTISPLSRSYRVVAILSDTKIAVAYREPVTDNGYVVAGTISGTSITFGTPVLFNISMLDYSIAAFNDSEFIAFYNSYSSGYNGIFKIATVTGNTITY